MNLKFLSTALLLVILVSGGAYYLISDSVDSGMDSIPAADEVPVMDAGNFPVEETSDDVSSINSAKVEISNFSFQPQELRITVGTKVVWKNEDSVNHNVISDKGDFASRLLAKGESFESTFNSKGTFTYYCGPHPWMKATVIVE